MKKRKKMIKFSIIVCTLLFCTWYYIEYSDINLININHNLDLPKPKSITKIIEEPGRDGNIFFILHYETEDTNKIKQQITNQSLKELTEKFQFIVERTNSESAEILKQKLDISILNENSLYFLYDKRYSFSTLIIFDEENLDLYYINFWVMPS